ncbi:MAG: exodeoxyribonuclease VII small subunit [Ignavibacteriae bacterium]|nr:MAG: exodeoxyribonuclease VII small subunit [Ignavibacteriota bacterium]
MGKKKQKHNFEKDLSRLEEISELLESNEIGLEDSISLYEEGIKLSKNCLTTLKKAELKVTKLSNELTDLTSNFNKDIIEE